ncbi:PspC domain-containing protein [Spirosoma taeanense]|uniref:PspC domain-containing protein n=1 Tax=Spirosoma taeanense TaxID=2735870 RepID=A0A6M5Y8U2_9BACT|nr:PspC domain-containing protein [Spirosoma taeanense]QJW89680.1 PspC domain-containing protein [Spirosoma taeanense]
MNKRLERISDEAMVGGVAAGLAHYFGWNRTLVRLIFLIGIPLPGFPALLIYIILWIAMPKQPLGASVNQLTVYANPVFSMNPYNPNQPASPDRSVIGGAILILLGILFLINRYFDIDFGDLWPFILIAVGLWLIFKDRIKTPYDPNSNNPNHPNDTL